MSDSELRKQLERLFLATMPNPNTGLYNIKPFLDDVTGLITHKTQLAALEAQIKAEHYWIRHYGEQRKFLDGSDGDIHQIHELSRHQLLHKNRLAELAAPDGETK